MILSWVPLSCRARLGMRNSRRNTTGAEEVKADERQVDPFDEGDYGKTWKYLDNKKYQ